MAMRGPAAGPSSPGLKRNDVVTSSIVAIGEEQLQLSDSKGNSLTIDEEELSAGACAAPAPSKPARPSPTRLRATRRSVRLL